VCGKRRDQRNNCGWITLFELIRSVHNKMAWRSRLWLVHYSVAVTIAITGARCNIECLQIFWNAVIGYIRTKTLLLCWTDSPVVDMAKVVDKVLLYLVWKCFKLHFYSVVLYATCLVVWNTDDDDDDNDDDDDDNNVCDQNQSNFICIRKHNLLRLICIQLGLSLSFCVQNINVMRP